MSHLALLVELALKVGCEFLDVALVGQHQLPALLVQALDLTVSVVEIKIIGLVWSLCVYAAFSYKSKTKSGTEMQH